MSSINPNNINGQYPVAGQDNDSQGFRDNFTNVKNNLTFAKAEIEDLQNNAILKSALSGTTLNNNLNYAQISAAQLIKSVETTNNLGTKTGSFSISWADGNFQYFTTSGDVNLTFTNWPTTGLYAKLVLQITTDTTNRTVTFPSAVSVGLADVAGSSGQIVTLPTAGVYLFELTTYDSGGTIAIQDLLRNYELTLTSSSFTTITVSTLANITSNTTSTSTTTGALKVAGGAGVVGNVYVGGNIVATGNITTSNRFVGNVVGNVTGDVTGNVTGNLTGNVTGVATSATIAGTVTSAAQANITSVGTLTNLTSSGNILSTGGGIGYATGAGGTVSQGSGSGKNTTVVLNELTGTITMDAGVCLANATTANSFTLTNSFIAATDLILVQHQSVGSAAAYTFAATPSAGSAQIHLRNVTQTNLSEAIVIRFAVIKSVNT